MHRVLALPGWGTSPGRLRPLCAVLRDQGIDARTWTVHPTDPLGRELRWRSDSLQQLRESLQLHLDDQDGPRWAIVSAAGDLAAPATSALRVPEGPRLATRLVPVKGHSVSLLHERMISTVADHILGVRV